MDIYNFLQQKLSSVRQYFRKGGISDMKTVHFPMREEDYKPTISVSITVPETFL